MIDLMTMIIQRTQEPDQDVYSRAYHDLLVLSRIVPRTVSRFSVVI